MKQNASNKPLIADSIIYMSQHPKLLAIYLHIIRIKTVQCNSWAGMFNTAKNKRRTKMCDDGVRRITKYIYKIANGHVRFAIVNSNESNEKRSRPKKAMIIYRKINRKKYV